MQQINDYLTICSKNFLKDELPDEIYSPSDDVKLNKSILKNAKDYKLLKIFFEEKSKIDISIKIKDLKAYINSKKISWQKGSCQMEIKRDDLLKESIEKINLYKELKINFYGEEGLDAGGLSRE